MPTPSAVDSSHLDYLIDDDVNKDVATTTTTGLTSYYSTNFTESNLPGAGRVLGQVYSLAGRQIERTVGVVAQKVGFRPRSDAIYQKIQELYREGWIIDEKKSMLFPLFSYSRHLIFTHCLGQHIAKLCFQLLDYALAK